MNIAVSAVVCNVHRKKKSKDLFDDVLQILSFAFYSVIFLLVSWHEEKWTFFSSMCESTFWFLQTVFKRRRLKEISVYHQHTVGVRGHALLFSGLCVKYGKVYNKCTMSHVCYANISVFLPSLFVTTSCSLCTVWRRSLKSPERNFFFIKNLSSMIRAMFHWDSKFTTKDIYWFKHKKPSSENLPISRSKFSSRIFG